ncbi:biotin--[acetyl-CoA-carboxylase] ligase [Ekhidna sp.]
MHKIFAKPLFLGKKVVFLPQCHSTNSELVDIARNSHEPEGLVLYTDHQQKGKGQRGNIWIDEPEKNILMSILLRPKYISISEQFYLNIIAGLAIVDTLKVFLGDQVKLKWPNDVYVNDKKISGILIESNLRGNKLESAVVGIGLNVNQKNFALSTASSLHIQTGRIFDRKEIMESLLVFVEKWYLKFKNGSKKNILENYYQILMWRGEKRQFKSADGVFEGEITGIDENGNLKIKTAIEEAVFRIKEIEFIG